MRSSSVNIYAGRRSEPGILTTLFGSPFRFLLNVRRSGSVMQSFKQLISLLCTSSTMHTTIIFFAFFTAGSRRAVAKSESA